MPELGCGIDSSAGAAMRRRVDNGGLTVNAIAGNHAVFLGFDLTDAARAGCLGFAVQREDLTSHTAPGCRGSRPSSRRCRRRP